MSSYSIDDKIYTAILNRYGEVNIEIEDKSNTEYEAIIVIKGKPNSEGRVHFMTTGTSPFDAIRNAFLRYDQFDIASLEKG